MAKAKLGTVTEKWIDGKGTKSLNGKAGRQQDSAERTKQTVYISKVAAKLLWHNRAETGEAISHTVERLVMEHFAKGGAKS